LPGKAFRVAGLLAVAVGLGSFLLLPSAKNQNPPAFKPAPLARIAAPRVSTLPVSAPPASAPQFSVPSPALKPNKSVLASRPEFRVVGVHNFEAQNVLKAGKPVEIGTWPYGLLERRLTEQSFPLVATELRLGDESGWQPSILLGYGQFLQDESAFQVFTSSPRREEPSCAYFKITLNF
jgi:hypothetical protein